MDEAKAHELACPVCARRMERLIARVVRLEKMVKALLDEKEKNIITIEGSISKEKISRMIELSKPKYDAE